MMRIMLALLFAAGVFSLLFSSLLPPSASLLAPTFTVTPTLTSTPTSTLTPMVVTSNFGLYSQRQPWESIVGKKVLKEDFEKDIYARGDLQFPYRTGNGFLLSGKSDAQFQYVPELLESRNFLHLLSGEQGLTFTFPDDRVVTAFGFDYTTSEEWQLTFNSAGNLYAILPTGKNQFMGVILYQNSSAKFTLTGFGFPQGGLSVDNISYVP
jgi:hypothetical protein